MFTGMTGFPLAPPGTQPSSVNNNKGIGFAQENMERIISSQWVQSSLFPVQCSSTINRVVISHAMTANIAVGPRTSRGTQTGPHTTLQTTRGLASTPGLNTTRETDPSTPG